MSAPDVRCHMAISYSQLSRSWNQQCIPFCKGRKLGAVALHIG